MSHPGFLICEYVCVWGGGWGVSGYSGVLMLFIRSSIHCLLMPISSDFHLFSPISRQVIPWVPFSARARIAVQIVSLLEVTTELLL